MRGSLSGILDFSLTNSTVNVCPDPSEPDGLGPCPIVETAGTWVTRGPSATDGAFVGVALVPFQCPGSPSGTFCYLDPTGFLLGTPGTPGILPLDHATDFDHHGVPRAKFIVNLYQ